jgi:hypothetical protein
LVALCVPNNNSDDPAAVPSVIQSPLLAAAEESVPLKTASTPI